MRSRYSRLFIVAAGLLACTDAPQTTAPLPPVPPAPPVLLRDIVIPNLPSPYYHFEYDTEGRVNAASFASGLRMYDVIYNGGRITEMRNNVIVNHDRLEYVYDDAGRVSAIRYVDGNGVVYTALFFSYAGQRLTAMERDRRVDGGLIIDKTISFA